MAADGSGNGSNPKRVVGRPWVKGQSGNPKGPTPRAALVSSAEPVTLTEAGRVAVQFLGGQLKALMEQAEKQELTERERAYGMSLLAQLNAMEATRGRLVLECLKLEAPEATKAKLLAAFTGETKDREPTP